MIRLSIYLEVTFYKLGTYIHVRRKKTLLQVMFILDCAAVKESNKQTVFYMESPGKNIPTNDPI